MKLSLTARELTRQTRRRGMYASRVIVPGVVSVALMAVLAFDPGVRPETVGSVCFYVALAFQYGVLFLGAPLMTADLIAKEKEERTLPLLLLTNAHGLDIVLSKYVPVLLICELLILSTLPMIAFAGFFGGVVALLGFNATLLNMATASAFAALGMLASSLTSQPRKALWLAYAFIAMYEVSSRMLAQGYEQLFPSGGSTSMTVVYRTTPYFVLSAMVLVAALVIAGRFVSHEPSAQPSRTNWLSRRRAPRKARSSAHALRMLVTHSGPVHGNLQRLLTATLLLFLTVACYVIGPVTIPLLVAGLAFQTASNVRRIVTIGLLDDLRLVPIERKKLGDAVFYKHFLSALFLIPALAAGTGTIPTASYGYPGFGIFKMIAAAILAFALIRYVVALASDRAVSTRAAILPFFVLARLVIISLVVFVMSVLVFGALSLTILWFRWIPVNLVPGPTAHLLITYALFFIMLMGSARDPRLRFAQRIERDLLSAER